MPPVDTVGDSGMLYLAGARGDSGMGGGGGETFTSHRI